jgi:hypothetical protein
VRNNVKRKNLNKKGVLVAETARPIPKWEEYPHTPGVFVRAANAGLTGYGTWKSVRRTGFRSVRGWENVESAKI